MMMIWQVFYCYEIQEGFVFVLFVGVLEYAEYMGMVPIDEDLLWIAKEGFNAPLPDGWSEEFDFWQFFFCI